MISDARELGVLRDTLQRLLQSGIPDIQIHGGTAPRLPHSLCVGIDGVDEERLFNELPGFAVSNGSACRGASRKISHVMKALGQPEGALRATVRFGLGRSTAMESIQEAATAVIQAVSRLRKPVR
jgi:cysteine desulfurase